MANKLGRNDQCTCGSGKKIKKCCGITEMSFEIMDLEWHKIRRLEGIVIDKHLTPYVMKNLPAEAIKEAFYDFCPDELPEELDQELLFHHFFLPWLLFNWMPYEELESEGFNSEITISQNYVKIHGKKLNSDEKRFIEAINQTYYSFYSVLEVEIEKKLVIKDILLGTTHTIKERQGTYKLKRGDIVFSRILTLDNQSIFIGMAPFVIPTNYHHELINLRKSLVEENNHHELTEEFLRHDIDVELCDYFFEIIDECYNRPMPTFANTDGDLIQYSKSYFKLMLPPEEALRILLPLTLSEDIDEYLNDAKRDKSGCIKKIEFRWLKKGNKKHKHWDNTVMGDITIQKEKLVLETNSEKRMQQGKKILNKYLGEAISFQKTLIESIEETFKSSPKSAKNKIIELPEAQEHIKAMAKAHWDSWFDIIIPVLDNQTPREAAKTKEGREKLEALLLMYERHDLERDEDQSFMKADIPYLKKELALE